ncbi:MAG: flagellar basal body rod protein FlgC [Candidatus Gastranaerophilales bacterium]|nr:flagellar basal body rod protein FlgC [Candidatus Gastranaerophilales bacterium]
MSFDVFDVSASGMNAQRIKLDTISSNIANINTTRKPDGTPGVYAKKDVTFRAVYMDKLEDNAPAFPNGAHQAVFSPSENSMVLRGGVFFDEKKLSQGVQVASIAESKDPYKVVYDPSHPDANADGYVTLPNVNVVEEMVNMVGASRAYEANAAAAETTKSMISAAMKI